MRYALNLTNYADFNVYEDNKLPGRSYFIPYPGREAADAVSALGKRYGSEKVMCLNGVWDFMFYPVPSKLPEVIDTDQMAFDHLDVPSCWQFRGYDKPFYVNLRYQFPFKPPVVPTTKKVGRVFSWLGVDQKVSLRWKKPKNQYNFVGVYRRFVEIPDGNRHFVISFLGVASCLDLYVNGQYVGYSEGAHNTAEFDLTGKLHTGKNELVAVVHRWCTGTYLEDQDMFRNNGIFRDVLLRIDEPTDFVDLDARTCKHGDTYSLTLSAQTLTDTEVTFTLTGNGIAQTRTAMACGGHAEVTFEDLTVTEWNAESPTLYTVYYETATSCVREQLGFRTVEIQDDVLLFNGKKIKFKGVNHHDTGPVNGYTMTPEEIERDIRLCKQFNIDTIRTSHYPPDPLLLELADQYGIYIVDENDLETHGTFAMQLPATYNTISHDPKWQPRYVDRISRLYQRDKLHSNTSIFMWSLGNEAGGYLNTDAMYNWLKAHSNLPVHYESAIHCKRIAYDVGSEMYPSVKMVHKVGLHKRKQKLLNKRPYFMCEYAHAMGVGPGDTESYWQEIYSFDNLMGGCVWEMCDHAVQHADGSLTYGGDHGEWEHDGNFCCDGLFYPDRTPSTGAKIIKHIYRPIRVTWLGENKIELFNTTAFSSGSRYVLHFRWNNGTQWDIQENVEPLSRMELELDPGAAVNGNLSAEVTVVDTCTDAIVSRETLLVQRHVDGAPGAQPLPKDFSVEDGIPQWKGNGQQRLTGAEEGTLLYHAPTDNDTGVSFRNTMLPYTVQTQEVLSTEQMENGGIRVVSRVENKKGIFQVTDTYEGCAQGILVTSRIHCTHGRGILPRFGKCFRLDSLFDMVEYVGRTGESYCDMKEQFPIDRVRCRVADMTEPNLRPQESGNRCDCTEATLSTDRVKVTFTAVDKPFELAVKPYTDRALMDMRHRSDEKRTGTYVTIQAFHQGIGTGACGPAVQPQYQYSVKEDYELKFVVSVEFV